MLLITRIDCDSNLFVSATGSAKNNIQRRSPTDIGSLTETIQKVIEFLAKENVDIDHSQMISIS